MCKCLLTNSTLWLDLLPSLADIEEVEADSRRNNDYIADGDQSSDSSVEMEKIQEKTKEKWDCESILSKCKMLNGFVLATECIVLRLPSCRCFFLGG